MTSRLPSSVALREVLVVYGAEALLAAGVLGGYAVLNRLKTAGASTTPQTLRALHQASEIWRADRGGQCPTIDRLFADKAIDVASQRRDEWNHEIWITCVGSSRVDLQACKLEYSIVSPK